MTRIAAVLAAAITAASLWVDMARAAPVWLPLQRLGVSVEKKGDPRVALNTSGRAVSVFERYDGQTYVIQAAVRTRPLGSWTVRNISPSGGDAFNPQVALDRAGSAVVVWQQVDGPTQVIRAITGRGTRWGEVRTLSTPGAGGFNPRVAGNEAGVAVAVWQRASGTQSVIDAARHAAGTWSATQTLSDAAAVAVKPDVAVDAAGNAVAIWEAAHGGTTTVRAAVSAGGGAWSPPFALSSSGGTDPQVAIEGGEIVAVWRRAIGSDSVVETVAWRVGSAPSSPQVLTRPGQRSDEPDIAIGGNGRAVAAWRSFDGSKFVVFAAARARGAGFEPPRALSQPREDSVGPRVAMDRAGNAVVVWVRPDGTNDIAQAATRLASAPTWLRVANVSPPGGDAFAPEIALVGGRGIATFVRSAGSQWVWSVADYLTAPPPQGFVSRAYVAAVENGPPVARLQGRRNQIWVYFFFAVQPRPGRPITVTWYEPGGRVAGSVGKPRARVIETFVAAPGGLKRGVWRAVLRVGGVVVKQASVRIG